MLRKYLTLMFVALALLPPGTAIGQEKLASADEVSDPEIKVTMGKTIPRLKSTDSKERESALRELHESLTTAANTREVYPQGEDRKQLSKELTQLYRRTKSKEFSDPSTRLELIYDLARFGDNEVAKPLILEILDHGSKDERSEALRGIGSPAGVSGGDLYEKIEELARRKIITEEAKATYLSRVDKNRALVKILAELRTTKDKRTFLYRAWTLQDSYRRPADFKEILPRLKELGLTKSRSFDGKSDGLFWVNAELLAAYVDIAQGNDLKLALEMMAQHGALTRPISAPALIRRLEHPDPEIRVLAAQALEKVMGRSLSDKKGINAALNITLQKELDPQAKKSIQDVIARIARTDQEWQEFLDRTKKDRQR